MQVQFPPGKQSSEFVLARLVLRRADALLLAGAAIFLASEIHPAFGDGATAAGVCLAAVGALLHGWAFASYSKSRGTAKSAAPTLTHRSG